MAADWRVERSAAARRDIVAIFDYLVVHEEAVAYRFLDAVDDIVGRLRQFPRLGSGRELLPQSLRAISFWPFLLIYRLQADRLLVQIVRVIDARRDLASLSLES